MNCELRGLWICKVDSIVGLVTISDYWSDSKSHDDCFKLSFIKYSKGIRGLGALVVN